MVVSALLAINSSCIKKKETAPKLLGTLKEAKAQELIAEVNRIAELKSLRGKVDIQFEDNSFSQLGLTEKYRTAEGTVIVQRPEKINLKIQVPFFGTNVAEMTSDGEHFRVAVMQGDEKYRRFIKGTNRAFYPTLKTEDDKGNQVNKEKQTVSVLSKVRPQHFTDALLLKPIKPKNETGWFYSVSEFFQDEPESSQKKKDRVMRGYYLLEELSPNDDGSLNVVRRFWFDRVNTIRLARVQSYNEDHELISDVVYGLQAGFGENGSIMLPLRVEVTRIKEQYKLSFVYQTPAAVSLNEDYPSEAFVLENTRGLPEVDLDKK